MNERNRTDKPERKTLGDDRADAWLALALTQETPPGRHPDDDTLAAWHERRLDAAAARQVEAHVAHCERCFGVWSDLLALDAPARRQRAGSGFADRVADALRRLFGTRAGTRRLGAVAAALIAALALSVMMFDGGQPLPDYRISLEGNTRYFRDADGGGAAAVIFEPGNRFQVVLTPETANDRNVDAVLYVVTAGGRPVRLATPPPEAAGSGALRIVGEVGDQVVLPAGAAELLVVVGQRGHLPTGGETAARLGDRSTVTDSRWQAWRIPIELKQGLEQ